MTANSASITINHIEEDEKPSPYKSQKQKVTKTWWKRLELEIKIDTILKIISITAVVSKYSQKCFLFYRRIFHCTSQNYYLHEHGVVFSHLGKTHGITSIKVEKTQVRLWKMNELQIHETFCITSSQFIKLLGSHSITERQEILLLTTNFSNPYYNNPYYNWNRNSVY